MSLTYLAVAVPQRPGVYSRAWKSMAYPESDGSDRADNETGGMSSLLGDRLGGGWEEGVQRAVRGVSWTRRSGQWEGAGAGGESAAERAAGGAGAGNGAEWVSGLGDAGIRSAAGGVGCCRRLRAELELRGNRRAGRWETSHLGEARAGGLAHLQRERERQ